MSELFNEVDEELRREQIKKIWDRYSGLIVGVALAIVLGVGGWRGYEYYQGQKAAEVGAAFESAVSLSEQNKHEEAQAAFSKIATESGAGYRRLARFRAAAELGARDQQAAVRTYDALAADTSLSQDDRDLAQLRASELLIDSASYDDLQKRLEPLTGSGRIYRHSAREYLALSAWRNNNGAAARNWVDLIMTDAETPDSLRRRAESLQALLPPSAKG